MILKIDAKFEEKPFVVSKLTKIWLILIRAFKSLQNLHFNSSFLCKIYNLWPEKVQRGYFHDNEESFKIWRKIGLSFGKWHEEFDKFLPEHLKISKVCTLMSCFWPKYKLFQLKRYRVVTFDGTKYWCKISRKTDSAFKNDIRNLANFYQSTFESLKIWTFIGSFYPK